MINVNDLNKEVYKEFLRVNSGSGNLKIHAYAASEALPVSNLRVIVFTVIGSDKVIFFDGVTDSSGMIPTISLPAPIIDTDNLVIPKTTTYSILVSRDNREFNVDMYDGICVVQNINFVLGGNYGN